MSQESLQDDEIKAARNAIVALERLSRCQMNYEENLGHILSDRECMYRADMSAAIDCALSSIKRMNRRFYKANT